jgi:hypothetical protein
LKVTTPFLFVGGQRPDYTVFAMISAWTRAADGDAGIRQILATLANLKSYYSRLPAIRAAALRIAGSDLDNDQLGHVNRLAGFVRGALVYVADPIDAEFITTPDVLLCEIHRSGQVAEDCDGHVLLFTTLCESLGIPCDIAGVCSAGGVTWDHVIAVVRLESGELEFDLCAKCLEQPFYPDKLFSP